VADNRRLDTGEAHVPVPGEYVCIEVRDEGGGIPPDVLPRVFEPFFTTKEVGAGSGLGLAQVYGFARQSAGGVRIDSRVGTGTTVTLYLPAAPRRRVASPSARTVASPSARPSPAARVLVVEDDALVRGVVVPALQQSGFDVLEAGDATEALAMLSTHPGRGRRLQRRGDARRHGRRELARRHGRRLPGVAIVLATGYAATAPDPAVPVLQKPYTPEAVVAAIRRQLELHPRAGAPA
jgi:two-component system NtrC family sensor kinase